MKLGINLLLFGPLSKGGVPALLQSVREIGFTHVEIPVFERDDALLQVTGQTAAELGLSVSVSSALPSGASLVGPEREMKAAVAHHQLLIDATQAVRADTIAGPLYHPVGEMIVPCDQSQLQARLGEALAGPLDRLYRNAGVRFAMEPLNRFETNVLNTCADAAALCRTVKAPWLGVLSDTFHQHIEEADATTPLSSLGQQWMEAHASENHRGPAGAGQVDWKSWAAMIRASGPNLVVYEAFGQTVPALAAATRVWRDVTGDSLACARRSFDFLNTLLNQ